MFRDANESENGLSRSISMISRMIIRDYLSCRTIIRRCEYGFWWVERRRRGCGREKKLVVVGDGMKK